MLILFLWLILFPLVQPVWFLLSQQAGVTTDADGIAAISKRFWTIYRAGAAVLLAHSILNTVLAHV